MSEAALLRAVVAEPDDDAVRLVCADWLDEHGDSDAARDRAEFIRGQVELARSADDSPGRRHLAFRVRELLERHGEGWVALLGNDVHDRHFHRGFLDKVGVSAKTLDARADNLFRAAPLRRLRVTGLFGDVAPLRRIPDGHTLTALDLCYNQLTPASLERLTTIPALLLDGTGEVTDT
jgi:uncharacterized protein (TIGR02996 family)